MAIEDFEAFMNMDTASQKEYLCRREKELERKARRKDARCADCIHFVADHSCLDDSYCLKDEEREKSRGGNIFYTPFPTGDIRSVLCSDKLVKDEYRITYRQSRAWRHCGDFERMERN